MFADVEGLVMTSQATKDSMDGDGIDMSFVGSITSTRSTPTRADVVFYFYWTSSVLPFLRRRRTRNSM
jgi:hypothetical protein